MASTAVAQDEDPKPKVFGDWELTCAEERTCTLSQANVESGTTNVRMRSEINVLPEDRLMLTVTVPSLVLLTEGPWLTVDGVYIDQLNYISCRAGCIARVIFSRERFEMLQRGTKGVITVSTDAGQRIGMSISLAGLGEGVVALTSVKD